MFLWVGAGRTRGALIAPGIDPWGLPTDLDVTLGPPLDPAAWPGEPPAPRPVAPDEHPIGSADPHGAAWCLDAPALPLTTGTVGPVECAWLLAAAALLGSGTAVPPLLAADEASP